MGLYTTKDLAFEDLLHQCLSFSGMAFTRTCCGRCRRRAGHQTHPVVNKWQQVQSHKRPLTLVSGLILCPYNIGGVRVQIQLCLDLCLGQGVKLLNGDDSGFRITALCTLSLKIVVETTRDKDYTLNLSRSNTGTIANNGLERSLREVLIEDEAAFKRKSCLGLITTSGLYGRCCA